MDEVKPAPRAGATFYFGQVNPGDDSMVAVEFRLPTIPRLTVTHADGSAHDTDSLSLDETLCAVDQMKPGSSVVLNLRQRRLRLQAEARGFSAAFEFHEKGQEGRWMYCLHDIDQAKARFAAERFLTGGMFDTQTWEQH